MPDLRVNPISVVNQIKSNLQDRYDSGYAILKELLQNADDAEAQRFRLDALPGWSTATNPLLRGPGLLIVNDGFFRKQDESGITSFGESGKAADSAAIGKFGFGQKAVFHLCDAFIVHAQRENGETFSTVVNPFLEVEIASNVSRQWEPPDGVLDPSDVRLLGGKVASGFPGRHLALWLPLRREGIQLAPGVGFSSNMPSAAQTIRELVRPDDLHVLLTALRHLKSIEILEVGEVRCALKLDDARGRLLGPPRSDGNRLFEGVRAFGGAIESTVDRSTIPFVGREAVALDERLAALKRAQHWPQTITVLSPQPIPEKGEPHGAATLLRIPEKPAPTAQLRISWAVFLPISDASDIVVSIEGSTLGQINLLLHGFFFLDGGRRYIEGLEAAVETGEPADASALRRTWNAELRDSVVLPLLPTLLRDALGSALVTSSELTQLVLALARHDWFRRNREAICREHALVRALEASGSIVWRVVSSRETLRPLPASVADAPQRIGELFGDIGAWAEMSGARLVVGASATLSARPLRWTEADLSAVFLKLSSRAFQSRDLARLLVDFLGTSVVGDTERAITGPHIVAALRKAMTETQALAPSELVKSAVDHVPHSSLFPLPPSVENRNVLRALASVPANVLPVRSEWFDDGQRSPQLPYEDLKPLLTALEPLIDGDHSDQAATAALALLARAGPNITDLARDPEFAAIKVLRARDVRARGPVVLSLQMLVDQSRAGLLFANSPQSNSWLPLLVDALPEASPLIVEGITMQLMRDMDGAALVLQAAGKDSAVALINKSQSFGTKNARQHLLTKLGIDAEDDPAPARRLCAGSQEAGYSAAKLWTLDADLQQIERIATAFIDQSSNEFLVPTSIVDGLSRTQRNHVRIEALDAANLENLFGKNIAVLEQIAPTVAEREAILGVDFTDNLLIRLPIHERQDGTVGDGVGVFRMTNEWPVPGALLAVVSIVRPCRSQKARERQEQLIEAWSPRRQIEVSLAQPEPHGFCGEILNALAKLASPPEERLLGELRAKPWLHAGGQAVKPQDVLALPPSVDEAARMLLLRSGETPPFLPVANLPISVRQHAGFDHLERWVLPDQRSSFDALALMVEDAEIIGRLGAASDFPTDSLTTLANDGGDIGLPGWPLLAAILASPKVGHDDAMNVVAAFTDMNASDSELAGTYLDRLAALAGETGRRGEAARRAFRHGFSVVAGWPEDARRQVFGGTRVPTEAGSWRSGREVAEGGDGLDLGYVLARDYASMLGKHTSSLAENPGTESEIANQFAANRRRGEIRHVDLAALETQSVDQQRSFLDAWKGRIPSDLVIVYLGLIGRGEPFRRLANEWAIDATVDVDTSWAALDNHFPREILHPNTLATEIDQRRFLIKYVTGQNVQETAMSGDTFEAPLGGPDKGILIGRLHETHQGFRAADGRVRSLITLQVRQVDPSGYSHREASGVFRQFVEKVATDCLWLSMQRHLAALEAVLDKAVEVDQSTIEETERLLRDRLPTILAELKLPTEYRSQKALREYQAEESRLHHLSAPAQRIEELKAELWRRVSDGALAVELLAAVRSKIGDFGYSASRVLFELFQNADDAYRQHDGAATDARFRVEPLSDGTGGFRVIHWGRPINHLGRDADEGRRLGHDRDLLNMLLMNFSEKRPGDDLTGKFGLGFKSVHVLSDNVGIASGFIALRTLGGFLPAPWPAGNDIGEKRKRASGQKATVIDVPFSEETMEKGAEAIQAFRAAVTWIPVFARTIRRVEIEGDIPLAVDCSFSQLLDQNEIRIVSISGWHRERALHFDLSFGFCLLLRIGAAGPFAFSHELRRLWNLAPLEEKLRSGWLINGPFAVDPGRTGLAGSIAERQETFRKFGQALGGRLLTLHDLADADWHRFAECLDLDTSKATAWVIFWSHLFDVLAPDFDDDLARYLHADGRGYGHLAGHRQVVPTHLPAPFAPLVRWSHVDHFTDGALSDGATLSKVRNWPALIDLQDRIVASDVAGQLKKLGLVGARPLSFSGLLRRQIGVEKRIDPELARTLGNAVTRQSIREAPLDSELHEILDITRQALFLAQDETWRIAQLPCPDAADDPEERRLCAFAPAKHLLDKRYTGGALQFFRVARERSGFGPQAHELVSWLAEISSDDGDRQKAALRYAIEGRQGRELGDEIRRKRPTWVPWPASQLRISPLLSGWTEKEKDDLLYALEGRDAFLPLPPAPALRPEPKTVLAAIHAWWRSKGANLRSLYSQRLYPSSFSPPQLLEGESRTPWFTMFALACFQSFGRTQDGQHRSFIETGYREGWWLELAESRPSDDIQPWLERLERWSAPHLFDQQFLIWRRTFVDLYTVARWLEEYREITLKLPRIIEDHGVISLNAALQPSYWAPAMRLCIDAAPINRSLGIGVNWMIRELLRHGVYGSRDENHMAPYGWAPSQRTRDLLNGLGADVGERADKEASRTIHDFVTKHLGNDRRRFDGDFDLPLQLITREENRAALEQCFDTTNRDPPTFDKQDTDDELQTEASD